LCPDGAARSAITIGPEDFVGGPLLVQAADDLYLAIAEAALVDYAGMYLARDDSAPKDGVTLVSRLARQKERKSVVSSDLPQRTPWRVIMVARQPVNLLENDMLLSLNAPCAIADPSWIQPGMMAWDHWWSGDVKMDTATIKQYISRWIFWAKGPSRPRSGETDPVPRKTRKTWSERPGA